MTHPSERLVNGPTRDEGEEFREQLVENPSSRLIFEERVRGGGERGDGANRLGRRLVERSSLCSMRLATTDVV